MKLCKDCKHARWSERWKQMMCAHVKLIDPVWGQDDEDDERWHQACDCVRIPDREYMARWMVRGWCGPDADWFEAEEQAGEQGAGDE